MNNYYDVQVYVIAIDLKSARHIAIENYNLV